VQQLAFGVLTGSTLALASLGFVLIRQTQGFLNIAHGQFLAWGAFLGFVLTTEAGLNVVLAGVVVMVGVGILGVVAARLIFAPLVGRGALALFFSSIGLAYALYGLILAIFDPEVRAYTIDFGEQVEFLSASLTVGEITMIVIAWTAVGALHVFLTRTNIGLWIRASASDSELAKVRGIPSHRVSDAAWFLAAALGALAGVIVGALGTVHTELGWSYIVFVLAAAILGGVGNLYGVLVAGLLLGVAMDLSTLVIATEYRPTIAFGAIIVTLFVRPHGLFSVAARGEETA
jgi:branched-chain amino acid transport system permease protein